MIVFIDFFFFISDAILSFKEESLLPIWRSVDYFNTLKIAFMLVKQVMSRQQWQLAPRFSAETAAGKRQRLEVTIRVFNAGFQRREVGIFP